MRDPVCLGILAEVLWEILALPEENATILFELLVFFAESMVD